MAKKIIDISSGTGYWRLAPDEFIVAIDTTYDTDYANGYLASATTITVSTSQTPYTVDDADATWYPVYYDEAVSSAVAISNSAGIGAVYAPFPGIGKVIGPMRIALQLDATWVSAYGTTDAAQAFIIAFTNTK